MRACFVLEPVAELAALHLLFVEVLVRVIHLVVHVVEYVRHAESKVSTDRNLLGVRDAEQNFRVDCCC